MQGKRLVPPFGNFVFKTCSCARTDTRKQIKKTGYVILGGSLLNMKGESTKICKWKAVFKIVPDGVVVADVKDLPEVRLVTQVGNNKYITSIEITTSDLSFVDAIAYSELLANRCVDLISYIVGRGVSCSLTQIIETGPPGIVREGHAFMTLDTLLAKPQYVDITTASFSDVLQNRNQKLARQLSHYRRGIASSDIIEQIREFYLVLEDEYPDNHPSLQRYRYVRNLVSHAEVTNPRSEEEARRIVGKTYIDPSAPQDLAVLRNHLNEIKCEAERVVKSKV
jgi:hypothetical protein